MRRPRFARLRRWQLMRCSMGHHPIVPGGLDGIDTHTGHPVRLVFCACGYRSKWVEV